MFRKPSEPVANVPKTSTLQEDLYSGYEDENHASNGFTGLGVVASVLRGGTPSPTRLYTAARLNTASGRSPIAIAPTGTFGIPGTALRMGTAMGGAEAARPMTAVKGAGYSSSKASGGSRSSTTPLERPKGPSPAEQCRKLERDVHELIEEAAALADGGDYSEGTCCVACSLHLATRTQLQMRVTPFALNQYQLLMLEMYTLFE